MITAVFSAALLENWELDNVGKSRITTAYRYAKKIIESLLSYDDLDTIVMFDLKSDELWGIFSKNNDIISTIL